MIGLPSPKFAIVNIAYLTAKSLIMSSSLETIIINQLMAHTILSKSTILLIILFI
jgi:hypothetical protein